MADDKQRFRAGDRFGPYEILHLLGQGGMGEVYLAREPQLDRSVAIKLMSGESAKDPELRERFLAEGRALARIQSVNVVTVYRVDEYDGQPFIAMEYVDGHPLSVCLDRGLLAVGDSLIVFRQTLEGIREAHRKGVIHRDLKPSNVLVTRQKQAKIIDFGIAKMFSAESSTKTTTGVLMGTLNYLAPEIAKGQAPGPQTDIYGLGAILFEMLTGQKPFTGENQLEIIEKIKTQPLDVPQRIRELVPTELIALMERMTAKDPLSRYASIDAVLVDLAKIDFTDLPPELKAGAETVLDVANEREIREVLRKKGYVSREVSLVIGIAARIETDRILSADRTVRIDGPRARIQISPEVLESAARKLDEFRTANTTRRRASLEDKPGEPSVPLAAKAAQSVSPLALGALFVTVLLLGVVATLVAMSLAPQSSTPAGPSVTSDQRPPEAGRDTVQTTPGKPATTTTQTTTTSTKPQNPTHQRDVAGRRPAAGNEDTEVRPKTFDPDAVGMPKEVPDVSVPLPRLRKGDSWEYSYFDERGESHVISFGVLSVDESRVTFVNAAGDVSEGSANPFFGLTRFRNDPFLGTGRQRLSGNPNELFPLSLLKKLTLHVDGESNRVGSWNRDVTCLSMASGFEKPKFRTPAGEFDYHTVVCRDEKNEAAYHDLFYYSHEVGNVIFWSRTRAGQPSRVVTLRSYKRAPED